MSTFKPSPFQQAIFDFISQPSGSSIIEAVAGSGKTTTIVEALKIIPTDKKVVFLAFNKSIAAELQTRVPAQVNVATLNSLGHRSWLRFRDGVRVALNANKTRDIINKVLSDSYLDQDIRRLGSAVRKLVSVAKAVGLAPSDVEGVKGLVEDIPEVWDQLIEHFDIQFGGQADGRKTLASAVASRSDDKDLSIRMARDVLKVSLEMLDEIDFDDQLYMTVLFRAPVPKYDFVFVDEAQDVSDIQRALLGMAKKETGRLVAVGDPCQAIYGFRGASSESLNNIANEFGCVRLPLSISYRCPQAIVREAQQFVSHIQAAPTAPEGEVQDMGIYTHTMFQPKDMVICRNSAPLVQLAYFLIGRNVSATILGRDIGAGLVSLIEKLNPKGIDGLITKLNEWKAKETERLKKKDGEDADLSKVEDKYEVIMTFIESSNAKTVPALITAIESLFSEGNGGGVLLCTVHKSKGLEAHKVFILDQHLMPSKYAKLDWQQVQERNLQYVAVTRAKTVLAYVESPKKK